MFFLQVVRSNSREHVLTAVTGASLEQQTRRAHEETAIRLQHLYYGSAVLPPREAIAKYKVERWRAFVHAQVHRIREADVLGLSRPEGLRVEMCPRAMRRTADRLERAERFDIKLHPVCPSSTCKYCFGTSYVLPGPSLRWMYERDQKGATWSAPPDPPWFSIAQAKARRAEDVFLLNGMTGHHSDGASIRPLRDASKNERTNASYAFEGQELPMLRSLQDIIKDVNASLEADRIRTADRFERERREKALKGSRTLESLARGMLSWAS